MIILLKDLRQFLKPVKIKIDSLVFSLHYKATPVLLMSFCILLTTEYYWKGYINCYFQGDVQKFIEVVNAYCYVNGVHTMSQKNSELLEVHPGVSALFNPLTSKMDTPKFHKYYQWTTFFFFVQSISFCIPGKLWKNYEGGRLSKLCTHLKDIMASEEDRVKKVNDVVSYFTKGLGFNNAYLYMYLLCELLNLANVAVQAIVTDMFLSYEFSTLGIKVIDFFDNPGNRTDPLAAVFPKVSKCTFRMYGPSGEIVPHDGVCVLNLNSLNEKLFTIMWFWLLILSFVTLGNFLHRLICVGIPYCRLILLRRSCVLVDARKLRLICRKFKVGDWFILYLLGKNIDFVVFSEVLEAVSVKLQKRPIQPQPRNIPRSTGGPPIPSPNISNPFVDGGAGDAVYCENLNEIYMEQRNYVYA